MSKIKSVKGALASAIGVVALTLLLLPQSAVADIARGLTSVEFEIWWSSL